MWCPLPTVVVAIGCTPVDPDIMLRVSLTGPPYGVRMRLSRPALLVPALALTVTAFAGAAAADEKPPPRPVETTAPADGTTKVEVPPTLEGKWGVYQEVPTRSPDAVSPQRRSRSAVDGTVTRQDVTGPVGARLDVVIIGDGYTADEQDDFAADATARWAEMSEIEPYDSYGGMTNVWRVNAVSVDSGISRDFDTNPGEVQDKNTALGAYFWCGGTERLVCIDVAKVDSYARLAPAADLVVVVANSPRYGGAGYHHGFGGDLPPDIPYSGISTLSSDNPQSYKIAAHEIGHSLGGLADEYYYCSEPGYEDYCVWYGFWNGELYWGEVPEPNVTIYGPGDGYGEDYLRQEHYKWWRWLGEADPSGGTVTMVDGGRYYASGIYRPTNDSIMRSLSNLNFNLPGTEAMIDGFYTYGRLLSSGTPPGSTVRRRERLTIDVADVGGLARPTSVRWYVDGREARQARGKTTVRPNRLGVPASRRHTLSVTVSDATRSIRDPEIAAKTTSALTWTVVQ